MKKIFFIKAFVIILTSSAFSQDSHSIEKFKEQNKENVLTGVNLSDELSPELQIQAEIKIKEFYANTKSYLLVRIDELYRQNDAQELRKLCGTNEEIIYSIQHTYYRSVVRIEEFVQFDKEMNILGVISMEKMNDYVTRIVNESINFEAFLDSNDTLNTNETNELGDANLDNLITANHLNIPGTRLYIIPPKGYEVTDNFIGLKKGEYAAIQVLDIRGGNYYSNAATFNKEAFENKGGTVYDYREFKINNYPAKYIHLKGDLDHKGIMVVFGDSTFSTMVTGLYESKYESEEKFIKKAIASICYNKNLKIDPFVNAQFKLDDRKLKFKYAKSSAGLFIYSIDGIDKESYDNEPIVIVSTIPLGGGMKYSDVSENLISSMVGNGLTEKEIKYASEKKINGQSAYEMELNGYIKGEKSLIYFLIFNGVDKAIVVQGVIHSNFESNLEEIKKLGKSLKLK